MHIGPHPIHDPDLRVREVRQLFNSNAPSPFLDKDLDRTCEAFIESWALSLRSCLQADGAAKIACRSSAPIPAPRPASGSSTAFASSPLRRCSSWIFSSSVPRAISL